MARLLNMTEIKQINAVMLGLGIPNQKDSCGYSAADYGVMESFHYKEAPDLSETMQALIVMLHYQNTQLMESRDNLIYTLEELKRRKSLSVTTEKRVEIRGYNNVCVGIRWSGNNPDIQGYIYTESKKGSCKWYKDSDDKWSLAIKWDYKDDFVVQFCSLGYDCKEFHALQPPKSQNKVLMINSSVIAEREGIDLIRLQTDNKYVKNLMQECKQITVKKGNLYCKIHHAADVYSYIESLMQKRDDMIHISINLDSLKPWRNLVCSWNVTYPMMDLNHADLKFTPYPFQIEDIKTMLQKKVILNANDMGCGKTFESVVTGESMPMKKLVICPATLRMNWEREIKMVNPDADVLILYNDMPFQTGKDWTIVGYSSVEKFCDDFIQENIQCIFIDEAHYCQSVDDKGNPSSARARAVLKIAATAGWVYPLSGTPKPTRNKNLYNILRLIRHPLTDKKDGFFSFANYYCGGMQTMYGRNYNGNSHDDELYEKIKPYMIRHLKKEVLPDLKKLRLCVPVGIDLTEYHKILEEYRTLLKNKKSDAEQLQVLMRARKILALTKAKQSIEYAKYITQNDEKVIIVTCFTEVVKQIESAFKGNVVKIIGGMTDKQKNDAVIEFQNGKAQVLVMNIIAGGTGLTLTKSHMMIFNDYDWTVGNITQAEDRICRGGQTELCFIYLMTAKGAREEEMLVDMLTMKAKSIDDVIDNGLGEAIDFRALVNKAQRKRGTDA